MKSNEREMKYKKMETSLEMKYTVQQMETRVWLFMYSILFFHLLPSTKKKKTRPK